jgi:hypothetical protein
LDYSSNAYQHEIDRLDREFYLNDTTLLEVTSDANDKEEEE